MTISDSGTRRTPKKAALSGWIGSALEYYDFAIYAQAAALIFPRIFFPDSNPAVAIIASLATYAVGYVARPIGAVVLGHWGDRIGRKSVLVFAMFLMGVSTFAVGLLPTYAQIGVVAPLLLVLLRLIQGFAVAGELGGASAMIIEHAPDGKRGYYASFPLQGTQLGTALGSAVFIPLTAFLPDAAFESWGWRVPFMLSVVVVIAGYLIRRHVRETPTFQENRTEIKREKPPVIEVFRTRWKLIIKAILMSFVNIIGTTVVVFGTAYATNPGYGVGMDPTVYLWIPVLANLVAIALIPSFGKLSDRIGRRPVMLIGTIGAGLLVFPYLYAVGHKNEVLTILLAILLMGVLFQMWNAVFASFFQEMFPASTRVTGFAISQNIGLAIVAFAPTIFSFVAPPGTENVPLIVGGICLVVCLLAAVATILTPESHRVRLEDLGTWSAPVIPKEEYMKLYRAKTEDAPAAAE
ncbi:MFS transporter [Gulosibacter chungangensis]|uniref:Putative proline/betaine transporter n=1 Tax=Gulosibacter chungangensis TaxID=979746 RepID=A0A7J5BGZ4_9MICO|nr:MFS transporter [Gulosibacter chungangensis]KAB1645202.1 MHS family MFS transporter [Gulosibacter chungangensis]